MTLNQFKKVTKQVLKSINEDLLRDAERLYKSGMIDTANYENNAILPKLVLRAAMDRFCIALPEGCEKEVKNLRYC